MYASQWFLTIFTINLKTECIVRFLDCFFLDGFKTIYKFGLGILKINEEKILSSKNFDELMTLMKNIYDYISLEDLMTKSYTFSHIRKQLEVIFL